jgi:hypothetical protein
MPLPEKHSPVEHFQDTVKKALNPIITQYFKDVGPQDWDESLTDDRAHLRVACTHKDEDPLQLTLGRMQLFTELRQLNLAQLCLIPSSDPDIIEEDEKVANHPLIELFFAQDSSAAPEDRSVIQAEIKFRLMDFINEAKPGMEGKLFDEPDALVLARNIRQEMMVAGRGYRFNKGKLLHTYNDHKNGYRLKLYTSTENDAVETIKKTLAIRNHPYDDKKLKLHDVPKKTSENNPSGSRRVYGKTRKKARWRPTGNVYFRWATADVGLNRKIVLVDSTGHFLDALVRA